jgi:predicted phosphohydrolase
MLIDMASDIHLSYFTDLGKDFYVANAPVLALLGDVCQANQIKRMHPVFRRISETWDKVFYVLGNHEFYESHLDSTVNQVKDALSRYKNIVVMDNESAIIEDVTFIGTTLWSDMDRNNPITKIECQRSISDYFYIFPALNEFSFRSKAIVPDETVRLFNLNTDYLTDELKNSTSEKIVILSHHAPSYQSIVERYRTSPCNGAFASNAEYIMIDNPQVKLWLHGHCHSEIAYNVRQCQVFCHPKGYYGELFGHTHDYVPLTIEI